MQDHFTLISSQVFKLTSSQCHDYQPEYHY